MHWNFLALFFLFLWLATLAIFLIYKQGKKRRHRMTLEKHLSERDQSFLQLKQSEERYNKLITNMNEGLIFTDDKDQVRFINKCACTIFKARPQTMLNRSILDFVLSPVEAKKLGLPYELKRPGCSHREEVQMVRGNGEMFWASLNISYLDALHDHMPGAIIVMTDISEQKKAEEKLHNLTINLNQKVQQLDCLFDISDITNVPGISFDTIFERSLEIIPFGLKFPGDAWVEITFGDLRYASKNFQDTRWTYTVPIKGQSRKLGSLRVGYLEDKPILNKDPFHINEKILIKNIAEKLGQVIEIKNLELNLQKGLEHLDHIKKMAGIAEWEWDLKTDRKIFSPGFFGIMGVPSGSQRHYSTEEFYKQLVKEDLPRVKEFIEKVKKGESDKLSISYRILTRSGQERRIFSNATYADGKPSRDGRIIGIVLDLDRTRA